MSLQKIQQELKAPKNQYNDFGKYNYRNQEDILEALKPLLAKYGLYQTISDTMVEIGGRVYVEATVTVKDAETQEILEETKAYARESESKKGMDASQITGCASSYARKYALNGMYLIDDTKDADTMKPENGKTEKPKPQPKEDSNGKLSTAQKKKIEALIKESTLDREKVKKCLTVESLNDLTKTRASDIIDRWGEFIEYYQKQEAK